uniref:26S proteasome non-ATPase regulatory subunit 2-like n=1 Tax=Dermatophagoides pteronyssinus TaxID=6956 RepID=A0A6P6YDN4_DERPT|nr:26S proteasome non-ATPase regulatory subunit 2-like [Dermatophagoides pteronyssinus]
MAYIIKELEIEDVKGLEKIFKREKNKSSSFSENQNNKNFMNALGSALVHYGYGKDALLSVDDQAFISTTRDKSMISAVTSLGILNAYKIEEGIAILDRFQYSELPAAKAGSCLGFGLLFSNMKDEFETALNLICPSLDSPNLDEIANACLSLGFVYMGTQKAEIVQLFYPIILAYSEPNRIIIITFSNHFLQLDNVFAKRAIPIGLSLTFASNPNPFVLDILAKLTRNEDGHIAINSIIAIGIVAAGTNNVRAMNILVALTSYYSNDPNAILSIEFAQALIYSGKGLLTASPLNEYNGLINERRLAFLLVFLVQIMMHKEGMLTNKLRELFFTIIPSLYPRWLITLDSDLKPTPVSVRIGKPLDTAGMPGKPKVISSFYSHQAPVILQQTEAAELNTGEYQLFAHTLTGIVLSRKTPPHQLKEANHVVEI